MTALVTPMEAVAAIRATDLHRYAPHGVNHDKAGRPLIPSPEVLPHLTEAETAAYDTIATAGPTPFRRIEQEAIPLVDALARLLSIVNRPRGG
jgi:hypothetical protein